MHHAALICLLCLAADDPVRQINPTPQPILRQVVAEWDFADGLGGWIAEARCELESRNGNLLVRTTGTDPYMHARVDTRGGQMAFEFRARSTAPSPAQIYWITRESPRRGPDKSRSFEMIADNQWRDYTVEFKAPGRITDIRLDPADNAGEVEIDWIRLVRLGEHPLSIDRVDVSDVGVQFTVKNRDSKSRQFSAAGQVLSLDAEAENAIVLPSPTDKVVAPVQLVLEADDLPNVQRSLFVLHPDAQASWLDLPLEGASLQVTSDGSAARVVRNDQLVAMLAPLVHCDCQIPDFKLTSAPGALQFTSDGVSMTLSTSGSEIRIAVESERVCEGPVVRVFGGLEQGLLAGLEHLGKGEHSSTTLDVETEAHLRFAPKPLDVTMPLMSFVTDRASVSLDLGRHEPATGLRNAELLRCVRRSSDGTSRYEVQCSGPRRGWSAVRRDRVGRQTQRTAASAEGSTQFGSTIPDLPPGTQRPLEVR
jgi:hypothetical protein